MEENKLIGHTTLVHALQQAVREERLHHTLLFSGPEGTGKKLVATHLAATFLCNGESSPAPFGGCGTCHHCALIRAGNMPDLFHVPCGDKSSVSTETVRELLYSLRLRPFSGKYRFLIFDDAHLLQGQAANALLKSLEEPRPGTFFILISGKPHLMLRTIHSRAQRWGFHGLSQEELHQVLTNTESDPLNEKLVMLANGSIESYRLLSERKEHVTDLEQRLLRISRGDKAEAFSLGAEIAKSKETLLDDLQCLQLIGRSYLHQEGELRWANFLSELGEMDYYLLKRNFAPQYLLQTLLLHLADRLPDRFIVERDQTLDHLIP